MERGKEASIARLLPPSYFYAVLVDLGDAVADELALPFGRISLEMIIRLFVSF